MIKMLVYAAAAVALLMPSCTSALEQRQAQMQAEHARKHVENCHKDYESHVSSIPSRVAELREALPQTVRAEWQWSADCDACDEALLPKPVRLSRSEFAELKTLLAQAAPMPPLPQELFMTPVEPLTFTEDGQALAPVLPYLGCCGGVFGDLVLFDQAGNALFYLDEDDIAPASRVSQWMHREEGVTRPQLLLPDAAYNRFVALPSAAKARALDAALRKKLEHPGH